MRLSVRVYSGDNTPPHTILPPGNSDVEFWSLVCKGKQQTPLLTAQTRAQNQPKPFLISRTTLFANRHLFITTFPEKLLGKADLLSWQTLATSPAPQKFWSRPAPLHLPATVSLETGANLYPAKRKNNNREINPTLRKRTHGNWDRLS